MRFGSFTNWPPRVSILQYNHLGFFNLISCWFWEKINKLNLYLGFRYDFAVIRPHYFQVQNWQVLIRMQAFDCEISTNTKQTRPISPPKIKTAKNPSQVLSGFGSKIKEQLILRQQGKGSWLLEYTNTGCIKWNWRLLEECHANSLADV